MKTKGLKVIASVIVFVLMFTYISIVQKAVAISTNELNEVLQNEITTNSNSVSDNSISGKPIVGDSQTPTTQTSTQNGTKTGNENVDFDVYFERTGNNRLGALKTIGEENFLYVKVMVGAGYLKSSSLTFDNPNFKIVRVEGSDYVAYTRDNSIVFTQIPTNTEFEIKVFIESLTGEKVPADSMFKRDMVDTFSCVYVNNNGQERTVTGTSTVSLTWNTERTAEFDLSLENALSYTNNSRNYILLQLLATAKLTNNVMPLSKEKIEITLPTINSTTAEYAKVTARTTKSVNGEENGESFSSSNYTFADNKVTIEVNNTPDTNGKISWKKNAQDEYLVTLIYDATNINFEELTSVVIPASKATLTAANNMNADKEQEGTRTLYLGSVTPKNVIEYDIKSNTNKISKGQIYANYNSTTKLETEYDEIISANITYADMVQKISIGESVDNFVSDAANGPTTYNNVNYAYFKKVSISKNIFDRILGENGNIVIYNDTGIVQIGQINKDTSLNISNEYEVDISNYNVNEIRIETTAPVAEGNLLINIKKAIKGDVGYTAAQMQEFTGLQINAACNTTYNYGANGEAIIKMTTIPFAEPTTVAELTIDKPEFSTVVENKNVRFTTVLRTDSTDYKLFKDPTLNITFPSYIENVTLKNVDVRFETDGTRLNVLSRDVVTNPNGTKSIVVELEGTQTEYTLGAISRGVNVIVTADVSVNKQTASKEDSVVLTYTNNYIGEETKTTAAGIS